MNLRIRLISTDFDGTLIGHPSDGRCIASLAEALESFKAAGGLWAINTGRSLEHIIEGLETFQAPVEPDYLLTNEREVFERDQDGRWVDVNPWNLTCRERHRILFEDSAGIFDDILARLDPSEDVTIIRENDIPVGLVTTDEKAMEWVATKLDEVRQNFPEFGYQRNTVYVRFCHAAYHKGAALGELCGRLKIAPREVFVTGDHFNDLPMMDPAYAVAMGCPANAIPQVKDRVTRHRGSISNLHSGAGVAEILLKQVIAAVAL